MDRIDDAIVGTFTRMCQDANSWDDFDSISDRLQIMHDSEGMDEVLYQHLCNIFQLYLMNYAKWFS